MFTYIKKIPEEKTKAHNKCRYDYDIFADSE